MLALFPPGDTDKLQNKVSSPWREFAFVLHQIQEAIEPTLSLSAVILQWNEIAGALAERSRKRQPQVSNFRPR